MPKIYEVIPAQGYGRGRSYTTSFRHAEEARRRAETQLELERSGELRRRELLTEAMKLQGDLQRLAHCLGRIGENPSILHPSFRPLPQSADRLERWIGEAKILSESVAAVLPGFTTAWEQRRREERAVREKRERDEVANQRRSVELALALLRGGTELTTEEIDEVETGVARWMIDDVPVASRDELDELRRARRLAMTREESRDLESRRCALRISREERRVRKANRFFRPTRNARGQWTDTDMRRHWRRERRLIAA